MSITSNITSGFIDLATFDELEKYMYGGPDATAYFVRETRKSTWFTQVPVVLTKSAGNPGFGQDWSVNISRAGDYLLQTWLRLTIPSVQLADSAPTDATIFWTNNLMHNLIYECSITFNDMQAARFDNFHLDFWAAFTTPAGKQLGYNNMIGNIPGLIQPVTKTSALQSATLNLPLPFFFGRDSGVALPTAALPYNEMRINFNFRDYTQLLNYNAGPSAGQPTQSIPVTASQLVSVPVISIANVWANYSIVSNDERKRMGCAPRDILMEQVYKAPLQNWNPISNPFPSYDLRFSYAIKVLFFAVQNKTNVAEGSNYTTTSGVVQSSGGVYSVFYGGSDPILETSLVYENTARLYQMGSDYFSLVNPWFSSPVIPTSTGYHSYSYSLDYICLDPMGSTNYGKLTNVSIQPTASSAAITAANSGSVSNSPFFNQIYQFVCDVVNNNIIRVSGGALGFPVL